MNTNEDPGNEQHTMRIHIIEVTERKEGGSTVVVQTSSGADKMLEQAWHKFLPGSYQGCLKVGRVWHLYYGRDPRYTPDSWIEVQLPTDIQHSTSAASDARTK